MREYDPDDLIIHKIDPLACGILGCDNIGVFGLDAEVQLCQDHSDAVVRHVKSLGLTLGDFKGLTFHEGHQLLERTQALINADIAERGE